MGTLPGESVVSSRLQLPASSVSTLRTESTMRESMALKLEEFKLKRDELRRKREKMFEENTKTWTQYTGKLEKVAARRKRQISLVESLDHRAMKAARNLDSQKHLSKRQEDKERERRDSSLERHKKEFEGVRGFSYTAGRFRTFDDGTKKLPKRTNRKRLAKSRTLSQRNKRGANLSRPKPKAKPLAK